MSTSKKSRILSSPDAYEIWSESYDQLDNPMLAMVDYALSKNPLDLNGLSVVELGCGTGRNVNRILQAGANQYLGLDQSEGMLRQARDKNPSARFESADIQKRLPVVDASIDFIFVSLVFEHLQDLSLAFEEMSRVLKPGGRARIFEIHAEVSSRGTGAHFQSGDEEIQLPSFTHDTREWRSSLSRAGFSQIEVLDWRADRETIARCAKLAKHEGRAVLLEVNATKA